MNEQKPNFSRSVLVIFGLVIVAALSRVVPHPYNFAPIGAIALFAGRRLENKWLAFLIPISALLIGDAVLGFHEQMPQVYLGFAAVVVLGLWLQKRKANMYEMTAGCIAGSVVFFVITNFAMWIIQPNYPVPLYERSFQGLVSCFAAALPFFHWTLIGDLFYFGLLSGVYALVENKWLKLSLS